MKSKVVTIISLLIVVAVVGLFFFLRQQDRKQLEQDKENFAKVQKEVMQEELDNLAVEYEQQVTKLSRGSNGETSFVIANDSLMSQLRNERIKLSRLQEELKNVKASNAQRIGQLTKEVGTLRKILKSYVIQIDSLHATNERLRAENKEVKENYERASSQVQELSSEKTKLTDKVNLAAKLDATAIQILPIDKKGKATKKLSKIEHIQVGFVISKNITAPVGTKTIYVRIMNPADEVMLKPSAGSFVFEGKQIPFSMKRDIEYGGEETPVHLYWTVEESLQSGTYRVFIFADGNLIGRGSFAI